MLHAKFKDHRTIGEDFKKKKLPYMSMVVILPVHVTWTVYINFRPLPPPPPLTTVAPNVIQLWPNGFGYL